MKKRCHLIDPLHLQGATRGSASIPVSQQILHRHASVNDLVAIPLPNTSGKDSQRLTCTRPHWLQPADSQCRPSLRPQTILVIWA